MTLSHSWMSRPVVSKTLLKSSLVQLTGTLPMNILVGFLSKIVRTKLFVCCWRRFLQELTRWRVRLWAASPCTPALLASSQLAERSDNIWLFKLFKVVQGCSRLGENCDGGANLVVRHVDKPKWFICEFVALCDLSIPRKGTLKQWLSIFYMCVSGYSLTGWRVCAGHRWCTRPSDCPQRSSPSCRNFAESLKWMPKQ